MEKKVCSKCGVEKNICEFNKMSKVKSGVRSNCRICQSVESKKYRVENKEKIKEYNSKWNQENKEYYKKYFENYNVINYQREKERRIEWFRNNKDYFNQYQKRRKKEDLLFRIMSNMRSSIHRYLRYKSKTTFQIIGCTPEFLKEYLEKQFRDGMSWENRNEWHIDHIIPLSSAASEEELYKLCHYTNLQPLWAEENLRKGNKIL
jgi:hypothetical protein